MGEITKTSLSNPMSLDEFDLNIINLNSVSIWKYRESKLDSLNCINDFVSISTMVNNSIKSKVLYVLPQNLNIYWSAYTDTWGVKKYWNCKPLKDILTLLSKSFLMKIFPDNISNVNICFENTRTNISGINFNADFYFTSNFSIITKSSMSEKVTTIALKDRIFVTTLDIVNENIMNFVNSIFSPLTKSEVPDWFSDVTFYDDSEHKNKINELEHLISESQEKIESAKEKLEVNNKFKSILYSNGDELVSVVFEILENILSCDLSSFIDKKSEDFLIKKELYTLIGEIKGVTSNIKSEHISQVERHYQSYCDKLDENGTFENVKQILIMNPFRTKPLKDRESVHEKQIVLASRNGCLIIETSTLLRLYEEYLKGNISVEKCEELILNNTGLLSISDFIR